MLSQNSEYELKLCLEVASNIIAKQLIAVKFSCLNTLSIS